MSTVIKDFAGQASTAMVVDDRIVYPIGYDPAQIGITDEAWQDKTVTGAINYLYALGSDSGTGKFIKTEVAANTPTLLFLKEGEESLTLEENATTLLYVSILAKSGQNLVCKYLTFLGSNVAGTVTGNAELLIGDSFGDISFDNGLTVLSGADGTLQIRVTSSAPSEYFTSIKYNTLN